MRHIFLLLLIFASEDSWAKLPPNYLGFSFGVGQYISFGDSVPKTASTDFPISLNYHQALTNKIYGVLDLQPVLSGDSLTTGIGAQYFLLPSNNTSNVSIGDAAEIQLYHLWDPYVTLLLGVTRFQIEYQKYNNVTAGYDTNVAVTTLLGPVIKAGTLYRFKDDMSASFEVGASVGLASGLVSSGYFAMGGIVIFL